MVGMTKLIASFLYFLILLKNAVHRPPGAEVTFLVEQGSVDLARRLIAKTRAVESLSDNRLLLLTRARAAKAQAATEDRISVMGLDGSDRSYCAQPPEIDRPQRRPIVRSVQRRRSLWLLVLLAVRI
jgi:hypothetical protein